MIKFEDSHNPEIPTREQVIIMFKHNAESAESINTYDKWLIEKMKSVVESGSEYSRLILNIDAADLLIECGMIEDASAYLSLTWDMMESEIARVVEENMSQELSDLLDALRIVTDKIDDR